MIIENDRKIHIDKQILIFNQKESTYQTEKIKALNSIKIILKRLYDYRKKRHP
jgi:hypothetical protein